MAAQPARGRVGGGVAVGAMGDVHAYPPAQAVDQASWQREQQQLDLVADEHGRAALGEITPDDFVGPLSVSGNATLSG
jgi:hypothetical protein